MQQQPKKKTGCIKIGLIVIGVLIVIGIIAAALSSDDASSSSPQNQNAQSGTQANTEDQNITIGLNQPVDLKEVRITAVDIQSSAGQDYFKPEDGNKFVGVQLEIENISDKDVSMSTIMLFDIYVDDVLASYSISANIVFGDGTLDGTIVPGKKLVGWIAVEAPENAREIELHVKGSWLSSDKAVFNLDIPE